MVRSMVCATFATFLIVLALWSATVPIPVEGMLSMPVLSVLDGNAPVMRSSFDCATCLPAHQLRREVDIRPVLIKARPEGAGSTRLGIASGSVRAGPYGNEEHFLSLTFTVPGTLQGVDVDYSGPVKMEASPVPFMVGKVLGSGALEEHPLWDGAPRNVIEASFERTLLSSDMGRGMQIWSVRLLPITYYPDGTVSFETHASICANYLPSETSDLPQTTLRKPVGEPEYLMVTHENLLDEVKALADWKSQKGSFAKVVTVQEISRMYTAGDEQAKVRRYVMEMERDHDLDYLLLVGDYNFVKTRNTKNIHPEVMYGEPTTFATDGYFACVDNGTTWDANSNRVYAEAYEIDDPIPDMAVGRLAINDPEVLGQIVSGLIEREKDPSYSTSNREAVFMAGDPESVPGDPTDTLDFFWSEYGEGVFDGRETLYYDGSGSMTFSSSSFQALVGAGPQAMCYFSHGTQTGLPDLYNNNQVSALQDTGPEGSMFAMACLTAWFDDPDQGSMGHFTDCFAEALTETPGKGLVGYIGSSRLAVGSIDTEYSGDAPGLEEDYWRGVRKAFEGELPSTIGDIYRYAVTHFSESFYPFPSGYYDYTPQRTFLEYNLLGEPEAPLFFHPPGTLTLEFTLSEEKDGLTAIVRNGSGTPVEGVTVALFRSGELGVKGTTDPSGTVYINIPASNGGRVNLTAWKSGDVPASVQLDLPDTLEPLALFSVSPETPDGFESYYLRSPLVRLYADEPATLHYGWGNGSFTTVPFGHELTIPEGLSNLTFFALDGAGHVSETVQVPFKVDLTAPELFLFTEPFIPDGLDGFFITPPRVHLGSFEPVFEIKWKVQGGVERDYSDPLTLYDGEYDLVFRARDISGNLNSTSGIFQIDLKTPYSTMNVSYLPDGENGYYRTQPTIRLEGYDERGAGVMYRWDSGEWNEFLAPIRPSTGTHLLEYRAFDASGNNESLVNSAVFMYDPEPPQVSINVSPGVPDGLNGFYRTSPSVNFSVSDGTSNDIELFVALAPSGEGVDWSGSEFPHNGTLWIGDGDWMLYVAALDPAGNRFSRPPMPIKVDTDRPSFIFNVFPSEPDGKYGWYVTQPIIRLNGTSQDARVRITLDSEVLEDPLDGSLDLPEGEHTVELCPVDLAGNMGEVLRFDYSCDLTDPVASIALDRFSFVAGEPVNLSGSSSSDLNGISVYRFLCSDGRSTLWMDSPAWNWTFVQEGIYSVWLQVEDPSGRTATSERRQINVSSPLLPPDDNNGTDDDTPIDPVDDDDTSKDDGPIDLELLLKLLIGAILILTIIALLMLYIRRRSIQEVEWEDEKDEDLDELDSIEEADVLELLTEDMAEFE